MENYIASNKEAWEEAFELRSEDWGSDITVRLRSGEPYAFFNEDTAKVLQKYDMKGKTIGQFCCNNGRELLSLVQTTRAAGGIGFDIAENMVAFANEKAEELGLPCTFLARNILDIGEEFKERFDVVIITIGATCWFKELRPYFKVVADCMKPGAVIIINEQHPFTDMLAMEGDDGYDPEHRLNCAFSYFSHEWVENDGMYYITGRDYESKTFTNYTHSLAEFVTSMCDNHLVVTGLQEKDYDISGGFGELDHMGFPLSMIIEGRKTV